MAHWRFKEDGPELVFSNGTVGRRAIIIACIVIGLLIANQTIRLSLGYVAWFGVADRSIYRPEYQPGDLMLVPPSMESILYYTILWVPMFMRAGDQIVVSYTATSSSAPTVPPGATAFVSCLCPAGGPFAVAMKPGSSELAITVPHFGIYWIRVVRTSQSKQDTITGNFWWGMRKAHAGSR